MLGSWVDPESLIEVPEWWKKGIWVNPNPPDPPEYTQGIYLHYEHDPGLWSPLVYGSTWLSVAKCDPAPWRPLAYGSPWLSISECELIPWSPLVYGSTWLSVFHGDPPSWFSQNIPRIPINPDILFPPNPPDPFPFPDLDFLFF